MSRVVMGRLIAGAAFSLLCLAPAQAQEARGHSDSTEVGSFETLSDKLNSELTRLARRGDSVGNGAAQSVDSASARMPAHRPMSRRRPDDCRLAESRRRARSPQGPACVLSGRSRNSLHVSRTMHRFEVGPVLRLERVTEDQAVSVMPVFGIVGSARLSKFWGIEGEITQANGHEFGFSREGLSETFAPENSTLEEKERLGVYARWRYGYRPGIGYTIAMTARSGGTGRADVRLRCGVATRKYAESFDFTVLSVPAGVNRRPSVSSIGDGVHSSLDGPLKIQRGGLLLGVDVPLRLSRRLTAVPEIRYVYGGSGGFSGGHSEASVGMRAAWRF